MCQELFGWGGKNRKCKRFSCDAFRPLGHYQTKMMFTLMQHMRTMERGR